ncbi:MAG TPA: MotA/TolQ/ExbB proton channel family protein [Polyangiales bacterium]|nr:MotA/TolQ/ExbB proton channel family protein [Polyangiales bacterium]
MDIVQSIKQSLLSVGASPVMWLMLGLSVASVAVMLERAIFFRRIRADMQALVRGLSERMRARDLDGARRLLDQSGSAEAAVASVGIAEFRRGASAVREAMAGATLLQRARLERGLGFLGTLASNTPFIGLFGTVIGIIMAFDHLSSSAARGSASQAVMGSIAEALVATAVGIGVAVPAVVAFNAFQARIRLVLDQTAALGHVLLTFMEDEHARWNNEDRRSSALLHDAANALARHTAVGEEA